MVPHDELVKMGGNDLNQELERSVMELFKLRLGLATRQSTQSAQLNGLRKYVARIKTIKRMRELEQVKENAKTPA